MLEFKKKNEVENNLHKYKTITTILSVIRLLLAFSVVVLLILLFSLQEYILYSILSSVFFVITLLFIIFTNKVYYHYTKLKNILASYDHHNQRRELNLNKFYDTGIDFLDKDDYKLADLDIFGKNSIYQYLSVCKTHDARKLLASYLINGNDDKEKTKLLVDKLATNEDVINVEALLLEHNRNSKNVSNAELNNILNLNEKFNIKIFIPIISYLATLILLILIPVLKINWLFILIPLITNLFTTKMFIRSDVFSLNSSAYHDVISKDILVGKEFLNLNIEDVYYKELSKQINDELDSALKLRNIYSVLSTRNNILFNVIFNTVFCLDLIVYLIYHNNSKKLNTASNFFDAVSKIEVLLSLASVGIDNEIYTIPEVGDSYEFKSIYHPLVKKCVSNDLKFDGGIILTGSNMSGKTTFLRTIGVNHILAKAGGVVLANRFIYPDVMLFTSLRTNDLLSEGISTFYAEILRMKKINESLSSGKIVILIDEIFKGTNLEERLAASKFLVEKFNQNKAIFIISTHDYEICDFENITNYHFEENYDENNKISFDYKIKEGKSTTKNALYLLKLADII